MIIELFAILMTLSVGLIFLGYYTQTDLLRLIGFTFIFLLGFSVLFTGLDYKTGSTVTTSGSTTTIEYDYSNYENQHIGFFLTIAGILGFSLIMVERRDDS